MISIAIILKGLETARASRKSVYSSSATLVEVWVGGSSFPPGSSQFTPDLSLSMDLPFLEAGMISLKNSVETKYIKIEFNDDLTTYGLEEKPLGVRTIQFYGCALEDTLAVCGTHFTRVSTNINCYLLIY